MKTLSKLIFLSVVLVFGVTGCNDGGGDSPPPVKQEPIPVPVPTPEPAPFPLPAPEKLTITKTSLANRVSSTLGFQEVGRFSISALGEKNFSSEGEMMLTFGGTLAGSVGYVRIMDISRIGYVEERISSEHTGAPVENKKATVVFSTPIVGSKIMATWLVDEKYTSDFSVEVALVGVDPIPHGSFADLTVTIETKDHIQFGNNVVVAEFPFRLAVARIETGKLFFAKDSEIVREDVETGVNTVLTFSPQVAERNMVPSRDGNKLAFIADLLGVNVVNVGIMDSNGDGCFVVDAAGCNQAYQIVQAHICYATERISLFPNINMVACPGTNFRDNSLKRARNIFLTQISPNLGAQLTNDVYEDFESVVSADGKMTYFLSCRPFDKPEAPFVEYVGGCGIFKREIIDLDKLVFGPIQYVVGRGDWKFGSGGDSLSGISLSPDDKQLVFSRDIGTRNFFGSMATVSIVNTDGTVLKEIGEGFHPYWVTDGRILYKKKSSLFGREIILSDSDGSNPRVVLKLKDGISGQESATSVTFIP